MSDLYIVFRSDTDARIGLAPGVGNHGATMKTDEGTVVLEYDQSGLPVTFTTILPDRTAVHSRHVVDGGILPSQGRGSCEPLSAMRPVNAPPTD